MAQSLTWQCLAQHKLLNLRPLRLSAHVGEGL